MNRTEEIRRLAREHVEEWWSPEGVPLMLADREGMATLERNIARELDSEGRKVAQAARQRDDAIQAMAEAHVRAHFESASAELVLADPHTMAAFAAGIRRQVRAEFRQPRAAQPDTVPASGFHLYRLWAADGRLLYVGVSRRLSARLRVHRQRWGDLIDHATWEAHADERAMLAAERRAITEEDPALNRAAIG